MVWARFARALTLTRFQKKIPVHVGKRGLEKISRAYFIFTFNLFGFLFGKGLGFGACHRLTLLQT